MAAQLSPADQTETAPVLTLSRNDGFFELDRAQCKDVGKALHNAYVQGDPFPHIVLDNFIDVDILRRVNDEFPSPAPGRFADEHSWLKTGYTLGQIRSAYIHDLLNVLNAPPFLAFLQEMTGIRGLVSDPYFNGGGLHATRRGGHLSIHADFNLHPHTKMHRRLNLILYLNENWDDDFGGNLELWDQEMKSCVKSVAPIMNRAVIFNTDTTSYHGHPDPLNSPEDRVRRSIALYYYTVPETGMKRHSTLFQVRPGSKDVPQGFAHRILTRIRGMLKMGGAPRP